VARNAAQVGEIAGALGVEAKRRARAATRDARRARILVRKHDVVLGAFAIDQGDLHHLTFGSGFLHASQAGVTCHVIHDGQTRLPGWACKTRTQKCRRKLSF
jgi:hypothetical protein